jgi:hypothetical protein
VLQDVVFVIAFEMPTTIFGDISVVSGEGLLGVNLWKSEKEEESAQKAMHGR